ncbi:MAG: hypothetical protein ACOYJD_06290 [Christensenellales bacterium]|jgi:predicted ribosomally synthesized peptide with SipW-like signal peptide
MKKGFFKNKKTWVMLIAAIAIIAISIGGTVAWLTAQAAAQNVFDPAQVTCEVWEGSGVGEEPNKHQETVVFDPSSVKEDVRIKNTSDIYAYIRVGLVPIWRNQSDGTGAGLNAENTYTIMFSDSENWFKQGNYYYYKNPVEAGGFTEDLIATCSVKSGLGDEYEGKYFELQIVAQAIQAEGTSAATSAWGVNISQSGQLTP